MFGGLVEAVQALESVGVVAQRVILIGGAAANSAVSAVAATMFNVPIEVPPEGEYVADGAAVQAAWALSGEVNPPEWTSMNLGETRYLDPVQVPDIQERYHDIRSNLFG
jgi:xylulokinase